MFKDRVAAKGALRFSCRVPFGAAHFFTMRIEGLCEGFGLRASSKVSKKQFPETQFSAKTKGADGPLNQTAFILGR